MASIVLQLPAKKLVYNLNTVKFQYCVDAFTMWELVYKHITCLEDASYEKSALTILTIASETFDIKY